MQQSKEKSDPDKDLLHFAIYTVAAVFMVAVVALTVYSLKFNRGLSLSGNQEIWGQFGDFLGGIVNPAVGLATVLLLLITVILQRKELRNALEEMRNSNRALIIQNEVIALQNFEQSFFTWLSSYRDLVSSVSGQRSHINTNSSEETVTHISGRDALHRSWIFKLSESVLLKVLEKKLPAQQLAVLAKHAFTADDDTHTVTQTILAQWEDTYSKNEHHVDSIFRTLYRLIRWIDEKPGAFLDSEKKWHYVSIIRAQISHIELVFLFYNGFTERGRKFNQYLNKYAFFDNLNDDGDFGIQFMRQLSESPFEAEAFNSDLARRKLMCDQIAAI